MWTTEQKRFLVELQTSKKHKNSLCKDDSFCCLGVYAECCCIENEIRIEKGEFADRSKVIYLFKEEESSNYFTDYEKYHLHSKTGEFNRLSLMINNGNLHSLAVVNDYTDLPHDQIAKFIYLYRDHIFNNFRDLSNSETVWLKYETKQDFIDDMNKQIANTSYYDNLENWKKELTS